MSEDIKNAINDLGQTFNEFKKANDERLDSIEKGEGTAKLDIFFDKFSNLPFWYQSLFIGVVASIYGLKGADIFKKK